MALVRYVWMLNGWNTRCPQIKQRTFRKGAWLFEKKQPVPCQSLFCSRSKSEQDVLKYVPLTGLSYICHTSDSFRLHTYLISASKEICSATWLQTWDLRSPKELTPQTPKSQNELHPTPSATSNQKQMDHPTLFL